jgi:hypothetical protein
MCHEIEPYPSKDKAMREGDNPNKGDRQCGLMKQIWNFVITRLYTLSAVYISSDIHRKRLVTRKTPTKYQSYAYYCI